ncbi:MAG TPA: phosphatase PAP2 family protein [candidate division Zixibacteria bacterium]|jgi:membrane-associated phospholipid phosphatase
MQHSRSHNLWRRYIERASILDRLMAAYIFAFTLGLAVFDFGNASFWPRVLIHCALLFLIFLTIINWGGRTAGVRGFIRQLYPVLLYPFLYLQTQVAVHWVFPGFLDRQIVALENALFGVDPNIWLTQFESPWINEWMMMGYFSYYPLLFVTVLPLHLTGRIREVRRILLGCSIAFVISYIGFVLYPLEGPRYFLADRLSPGLEGWLFVPLVNMVIDTGAIHGGCMPSSHTAVALVVMFWMWRIRRRLAWVLLPFVATLVIATMWGRFHYLSDVVIGALIGVAAYLVSARIDDRSAHERTAGTSSGEQSRQTRVSTVTASPG